MECVIPVTLLSEKGEPGKVTARPLFSSFPVCSASNAERALQSLQSALQTHLQELSQNPDQSALMQLLHPPEFETHVLRLRIDDGEREQALRLLFVCYRALDRWLAFIPQHAQMHFELGAISELSERASSVLSSIINQQRKKDDSINLQDWSIADGTSLRLSHLEFDFNPAKLPASASNGQLAGLGGADQQLDGAQELQTVGRLLNQLYPDHLQRAFGVADAQIQLQQAMQNLAQTPLLLLGASGVGKTTLLHEWLYSQKQAERVGGKTIAPKIWHLQPARLISGMSYLGQWEARLLAILRHAQARDLVLYFDDLLGLFSAGLSSGSQLTVGDLLLPWLQRKGLRIVAEITPESWRILRERRADFCTLFRVLQISELAHDQRWVVGAAICRDLERRYSVQFAPDVLPCAQRLAQRFDRSRCFPGNVVEALSVLAARAAPANKRDQATLSALHLQQDYVRRLGLNPALIDPSKAQPREQILALLRERLAGQDQAAAWMTEALMRAQMGLNDPKRPLGVCLFLGPTGVGKTQAAKALAHASQAQPDISGAANTDGRTRNAPARDALIRFDLNEYSQPWDAARLVGTWAQPDGLLTAAIRRNPNCVLLLDEIEKAAPEVFDLMLSLLDEGRLSDGHGQVADFSRAFIIMTSNLGAKESQSALGFTAEANAAASFELAARKHFRPEFFNRIDAVIGFQGFSPSELRKLTELQLRQVLDRVRSRGAISLSIDDTAIEYLMRIGLDPKLGARALKRGIERALVQPLARYLTELDAQRMAQSAVDKDLSQVAQSALDKDLSQVAQSALDKHVPQPIAQLLSIRADANGIQLDGEQIFAARAWSPAIWLQASNQQIAEWLVQLAHEIARIRDQLDEHQTEQIQLAAASAVQEHYFACREQLNQASASLSFTERTLHAIAKSDARTTRPGALKAGNRSGDKRETGLGLAGREDELVKSQLQDWQAQEQADESLAQTNLSLNAAQLALRSVVLDVAWLHALLAAPAQRERRYLCFSNLSFAGAVDQVQKSAAYRWYLRLAQSFAAIGKRGAPALNLPGLIALEECLLESQVARSAVDKDESESQVARSAVDKDESESQVARSAVDKDESESQVARSAVDKDVSQPGFMIEGFALDALLRFESGWWQPANGELTCAWVQNTSTGQTNKPRHLRLIRKLTHQQGGSILDLRSQEVLHADANAYELRRYWLAHLALESVEALLDLDSAAELDGTLTEQAP
jgi:ATP-dependent Clp protease ATP-binding subunit ClpC